MHRLLKVNVHQRGGGRGGGEEEQGEIRAPVVGTSTHHQRSRCVHNPELQRTSGLKHYLNICCKTVNRRLHDLLTLRAFNFALNTKFSASVDQIFSKNAAGGKHDVELRRNEERTLVATLFCGFQMDGRLLVLVTPPAGQQQQQQQQQGG